MKYRIKYFKKDRLAFISHLESARVFERAFRRANIELLYSNGFNPHPKMHFSPPLPLFASSNGEYMETELQEEINSDELKETINKALPEDMQIIQVEKTQEGEISLGKSLHFGKYKITLINDNEINNKIIKNLEELFSKEEILFTKLNKKKRFVTKDIKPLIFNIEFEINCNKLIIYANLSLVNNEILSPTIIVNIIKENFKEFKDINKVKIEKIDTILFSN